MSWSNPAGHPWFVDFWFAEVHRQEIADRLGHWTA
jgi:hypothetical protein